MECGFGGRDFYSDYAAKPGVQWWLSLLAVPFHEGELCLAKCLHWIKLKYIIVMGSKLEQTVTYYFLHYSKAFMKINWNSHNDCADIFKLVLSWHNSDIYTILKSK